MCSWNMSGQLWPTLSLIIGLVTHEINAQSGELQRQRIYCIFLSLSYGKSLITTTVWIVHI